MNRPIIAYIPTGTINDVGTILGIPKNIKRALKLIINNPLVAEMDVVRINNKYFVYAATGKFTKASYDIKRVYKSVMALFLIFKRFKDLFQSYNIPVEITHDEGVWRGVCSLILLLNGPRVAGFRLNLMNSKLNDGVIEARF